MSSWRAPFRQDAALCHELRWPGKRETARSRARLLFTSCGLRVLLAHRIAHDLCTRPPARGAARLRRLPGKVAARAGGTLCQVVAKCDILETTLFEGGVCLGDGGHIVLGARAVGSGTIICDHCTIGMNIVSGSVPAIGRDVWIGAHCVVYGHITIGDGATVLPDSVVSRSVPARAVVQGNPARVVRRDFDNAALRHGALSSPARQALALGVECGGAGHV